MVVLMLKVGRLLLFVQSLLLVGMQSLKFLCSKLPVSILFLYSNPNSMQSLHIFLTKDFIAIVMFPTLVSLSNRRYPFCSVLQLGDISGWKFETMCNVYTFHLLIVRTIHSFVWYYDKLGCRTIALLWYNS